MVPLNLKAGSFTLFFVFPFAMRHPYPFRWWIGTGRCPFGGRVYRDGWQFYGQQSSLEFLAGNHNIGNAHSFHDRIDEQCSLGNHHVASSRWVVQGLDAPLLTLVIPVTLAASCAFMLPMATPPNAIVLLVGT